MSPTERFKDHDIPFKREGKEQNKTKSNPQRRGKEKLMRWSPSTFPGAPTSSWPTLEHLGWRPQPPMPFGVPFPQK